MRREDQTMADHQDDKSSQAPAVMEMPWVLISNQIQLLSTQMNERFNDQRSRFEDRFIQIDKQFAQVDKQFTQIDNELTDIKSRLQFRNSTWLTIIVSVLSIIFGILVTLLIR